MRRLLLGLTGLFAGLAALVILKAPPGAWHLPPPLAVATEPAEPPPADAPPLRLAPEGTFTGAPQATPYGQVTVAVVVYDSAIIDVINVDLSASEPRSVQLNDRAGPILRERALAARSADFDVVSGATWTSVAYRASLQSAIDTATLR